MALIVQKYGGSSVGSIDRIRNVARRLVETHKAGNRVVAVVSAMSGVTDRLIGMAHEVSENPPTRELDMLMATGEQQSIALLGMAITEMGYKARSFTGRQAGIFTYGSHTRARIDRIDATAVLKALEAGYICICAGFQGIAADGAICTLGRGGSDLSAIALAAAVKADASVAYSDELARSSYGHNELNLAYDPYDPYAVWADLVEAELIGADGGVIAGFTVE